MALIEADALKQELHSWLKNPVDFRSIPKIVDDQPTIEAEPVRHGRWTAIDASYWRWKPDGAHPVKRFKYRHDECGKVVTKKEPYCPCCGAKMDGGEDHG